MSGRRFRIGIAGYSHPGGSGVIASELARLLAERGHEVHFIADAPPFRCAPSRDNLVYHEAPAVFASPSRHPSYTLALAAKMAEVARRCRLEILHLHYAIPHVPAAILARGMLGDAGRPALVTTLHGTDVTGGHRDPAVSELTRYAVRTSDAVTAVSRFLQRTASIVFPENAGIQWIPNFVDLRAFPRAPRGDRADFADDGELLLMHVSNFRPVKNPLDTLRVLAAVNRERPARLVLVGDGPELAAAWSEAGRLRIQERVRLLGSRVDVQSLLARADVFLLPSSQESFGLAALEALASGVPAVTSDAGGLPELIENGRSGYVVPIGDNDAMARRVLELVADARTLETHREEAYQRATLFDAERIVPMYEALYERSLK
jgi:N-acetyl-alpha-D-glucosaminyl L-malate synthase BshA